MNFEKMIQQSETAANKAAANQFTPQERSVYIKFPTGVHHIRPLPVGNHELDIPYKTIKQHSFMYNEAGKQKVAFALCWKHMFESEETMKDLVQPLGKLQKLTRDDFGLYKQYGCPICNAASALDAANYDKQYVRNLFPKTVNLWNIVLRSKNPQMEPDAVYVWSMSNKLHASLLGTIIETMKEGMQVLDTVSGFDWIVTAKCEGLQRRYDLTMLPKAKPLVGEHIPYNLTDIASRSFKTYQETIDLLKQHVGVKLSEIGYTIKGDKTFEAMTGTNPVVPEPVKTTLNVPQSQFVGANEVAQVVQQPVQQQPNTTATSATPGIKGVGTEVVDGKLYIDGVLMF